MISDLLLWITSGSLNHVCCVSLVFSDRLSLSLSGLDDNLTPAPIWHQNQFDTKSVGRTIWHQECKRVNLTPVPIWHQECKGVNLTPAPIWHRTNLTPRVQKSQFDTGTNLTPEPIWRHIKRYESWSKQLWDTFSQKYIWKGPKTPNKLHIYSNFGMIYTIPMNLHTTPPTLGPKGPKTPKK